MFFLHKNQKVAETHSKILVRAKKKTFSRAKKKTINIYK